MKQISPELDEDVIGEEEPVEKHAKWVGIVPSLLVPGAGQFLGGHRKRGLFWFIGVNALVMLGLMVMASPFFQGVIPSLVILVVASVLWILMLCDAYRPLPKMGVLKWLLVVASCLAIHCLVGWVKDSVVYFFYVPTHSMEPTIRGDSPANSAEKHKGDRGCAEMFVYWFSKPQRGDIIVFTHEGMNNVRGKCSIKRVVAFPGEKVSIKMGKLFVNGSAVTEPRVFTKIAYVNGNGFGAAYLKAPDEEYVVPAGHCFVLGDYSTNSLDSRYYGPVPEKNIIGKVTKIYSPPERIGVPE